MPDTENSDTIGGSATEITPSAHVIMVVIAPWTEPFLAYLTRQELPEDQNEACCIVRRSKAYRVHEGELYKKKYYRSPSKVHLRRGRAEPFGRNSRRTRRSPRRSPGSCKQSLPYRILLANGPGRCTGLGPTLPRLPAVCKSKPHATHRPPNNPHYVVLRGLGA